MYLEIECSSWANSSTTIGDGKPLDAFILKESEAIVRTFGNHPSFCMMMYGNEPAGAGSNNYLAEFTSYWKNKIKDEFIAQQADGPTCLSVIS